MRSTVTGPIITAERAQVVVPTHQVVAQKEILSFSNVGANSNASLDTDIPTTWLPGATGLNAYATFRYTSGTTYVKIFNTSAGSEYALSNSSASSLANRCMRSGLARESGTPYIYSASHSGSGVQVNRNSLGGTNPPTITPANFGPVFGPAVSDTSSLVRRVEAVCPTTAGVVVAVGTHDFTNKRSTIQFWIVFSGAAVRLNNVIQMPLTETYVNWYSSARYCSFISAVYDPVNLKIIVTANDQTWGRAVTFTVQNGVDSQMKPVIPIDAGSNKISLIPVSLSVLNGLFYLTARFSRSNDFTSSGFDCYLTSVDGVYWSFGEPSFFVCSVKAYGTLLMRNDSPTIVYYCGALYGYSATATKFQSSSSTLQFDLTDYVLEWSLDQVTNGADKLSLTVWDPSINSTTGLVSSNANVQKGCTIYLLSGQAGTNVDIGAYIIDDISAGITTKGRTTLKITCRDLANARMIDVNSPLELSWETRYKYSSMLSKIDDLALMTPEVGIEANAVDGWKYTGRNDPAIALAETSDTADVLLKATVTSFGQDTNRLGSFGFIFGADQDGNGNVVLLPTSSTWAEGGAITNPELRSLKLNAVDPSDPEKEDTGWNFKAHVNAMWKSNYSTAVRTQAATAVSRFTNAANMPHNTAQDVALKVNGSRITLHKKARVTLASTWAANAFYTQVAEWQTEDAMWRARPDRNYCGISLCTDVWFDIPVFESSPYEDIEQTLTDANNYASTSLFTNLAYNITSGATSGDHKDLHCTVAMSSLTVGQYIYVLLPTWDSQMRLITSISGDQKTITVDIGMNFGVNGATGYIYTLSASDYWGYFDCGKKNVIATEFNELGDLPIPIDPQATKHPRSIIGRAAIASDDSTAVALRWIQGDGVRFQLLSGDENVRQLAWDPVNPMPKTVEAQLYGGSDPSVWRQIFHHGYVFDGSPTAKNLPSTGYLDVDDECIRYAPFTFYRRGKFTQRTVTAVPAYYSPLISSGGSPTSTLRNWIKAGETATVGDDFKDIPNIVGLLVEVSSRNSKQYKSDKQYYVTAVTPVASPSTSSSSTVTLDKQYENPIQGTDQTTLAGNGDIAILSGRGQFGTQKNTHEADAAVRYSPRESDGTLPSIKVTNFDLFSGEFQSLEDVLRNLSALAGVRYAKFREKFSTPTSPVYPTLSTSPYSLPLSANVSNFTLDLRTHIPGWNTNGFGNPSTGNELVISFRGYYQLRISQYANSSDISLGRPGRVRVGLATTSSDISAASDGIKWIEGAIVQVSDFNLSGSFSGGGPAYTLTEDVNILHDLRVIVQDNLISLEINDRPVWTWNLDRYVTSTGVSLKNINTGAITLAYASSITSFTSTVAVQEMGDEQSRYVLQRGSSVSSGISALTHTRRLRARASTGGSIDFSRFETRDNAGSLNENMWADQWQQTNLTQRGHYMIAGNASGEYYDETMIQAEGYSFAAETGDDVETSEAATNEAKMLQREAAEYTLTRSVEGTGVLEAQPEDKITLVYAGTGEMPSHNADYVITQIQLRAEKKGLFGQYTLRKFVA